MIETKALERSRHLVDSEVVRLIEGGWDGKHILVVGDVMLDKYVYGSVDRISPEAPVPIVHASYRSQQPGGAANVAMNVRGLGGRASVIGFAGDDEDRTSVASSAGGRRSRCASHRCWRNAHHIEAENPGRQPASGTA